MKERVTREPGPGDSGDARPRTPYLPASRPHAPRSLLPLMLRVFLHAGFRSPPENSPSRSKSRHPRLDRPISHGRAVLPAGPGPTRRTSAGALQSGPPPLPLILPRTDPSESSKPGVAEPGTTSECRKDRIRHRTRR